MNGMMGMAQVLLNPDLPYQERQEGAQAILRSGQTMLALLNDLLDISKIEAGKFELHFSEVSPVDLVKETLQLFAPAAHFKKLFRHATSPLSAERRYLADFIRTRQMLSNLIGNAVQFTSQGEIRVEVREMEAQGDKALLEFSVTDTGIGIPQDQVRKVVILWLPCAY